MEIDMKRECKNYPFDLGIEEEELRLAALAVRDALALSLPEASEVSHNFSPRFKSMMQALIKRDAMRASFRRMMRSAAAVLLALLIGSGLWLSFNAEAKADFMLWARIRFQNSILYQYFGVRHEGLPTVEFGWLPKGYEQSIFHQIEESVFIVFSKDAEPDIVFSYYSLYSDVQNFIFNQDDFQEVVDLDELTSIEIYSDEKSSLYVWNDKVNMISFSINSNLSRDIIFKIIGNIRLDYG